MPRRSLAVTLALLLWGCSELAGPPTVSRVAFDKHEATLWAPDVLATSVSVFKTNGEMVANPPVTYTSSNPLVASVDSTGKVHAHVAGPATISAAVGSVTDELNVTVLWPPVTDVSSQTIRWSRPLVIRSTHGSSCSTPGAFGQPTRC